MSAILSILRIGRPVRWRLLLAVMAGAAAGGAAIGLAATSAWLISRAAEQPVMLTLLAAITAVRAFGISRGVFRYLERLAAHDAAFRVLGELRGTVYARLAKLAPAGLAELRSGDLLARLVGDVDGLADLWLRVLLPYASATVVAVGTVAFVAWMVPSAGIVLAVSLLVTAIVAPIVAGGVSRRAEARLAPGRGELADAALELLRGAPEIMVAGAAPLAIAELRRVDARLAAAERRSAVGAGTSGLVASLSAGVSVWAALVLGIVAVREGSLGGVALAVVALTPIAVHEVVSPLAPSARLLPGLASSARRVLDILRRPDPVPDPGPSAARPVPNGPLGLRVRGLRVRYPGAVNPGLADLDLDLPAGYAPRRHRSQRLGQEHAGGGLSPVPGGRGRLTGAGRRHARQGMSARSRATTSAARSVCASRTRTSSTPRSPTTSDSRAREPACQSWSRPWSGHGCWTGSGACRTASRPRLASTVPACRGASASASPSRGPCLPTSGSSSSTSPPSTSTSRRHGRSWRTCPRRPRVARSWC